MIATTHVALKGWHPPALFLIDHKNGDPLDNRIRNLRRATNAQNQQNKKPLRSASPLKGVKRKVRNGKPGWVATITIDGKQKDLGFFQSESDAHSAYRKAATEHFGEFARFT